MHPGQFFASFYLAFFQHTWEIFFPKDADKRQDKKSQKIGVNRGDSGYYHSNSDYTSDSDDENEKSLGEFY